MLYFCSVKLTKKKNSMHRLNFSVLVALTAIFIASGCTKRTEDGQTEKQMPVKVIIVGNSSTSENRNYVGTAEESFGVSLSFSQIGTVEQVFVSEGQKVSKGQLLAALNGNTAQNSYEVAKSTLNQAQDAYDRIKVLHDRGSTTDIQFVDVETGLEKAKGMEAIAKKNLEDTKLYAPFSGVIAMRSVEPGANIMPSIAAFKLVSVNEMDIKIPVPENEVGNIRNGQSAKIIVSALGDKQYSGSVFRKGVEANPVSHTYEIRVRVNNPQQDIMPGMVCKVSLQQEKTEQNIVVPNASVQIATDGSRFVWLADGDIAKRRSITIGALTDNGITVESGLDAGDKLIVEGFQKISDGMKIIINY